MIPEGRSDWPLHGCLGTLWSNQGEVGRVWTPGDRMPARRGHQVAPGLPAGPAVSLLPTKQKGDPIARDLGGCTSTLHSAVGQPPLGPGFPGLGSVCLQGSLGGCLRRRPCLEAPQEAPGEEGRSGPDLLRDGPCPGPSDPQTHLTWRPFLRRSCRCRSSALRWAGTTSPQDFARLSTCSDVSPGAGFWKVPSS